jgi:membrane-bound serine protease (ClpP class)
MFDLMRRGAPFLVLCAMFACAPVAARAQVSPSPTAAAFASSVLVLKVDGSIDRTMASYLEDGIATAEHDGSIVVIQLDTPGTLDRDPIELAGRIHAARVPVVVWVGPAPARASGAGVLFLAAASLGAIAPGVGVGPLLPVDLVRAAPSSAPALGALASGWAEDLGKPTPVSLPSGEVPAQAALDANLAQIGAGSISDLLDRIDGRTVRSATGPLTLHTEVATAAGQPSVGIRFTSLGPVDRVLHAAASPAAIYVLLVLGLAALAFELTQPGFGFAGVAAVAMLGLGGYGLSAVPASWPWLGLLVFGIVLMDADVVLRRLGPLTLLGAAGFAGGSLLAFGDVSPTIGISPWLIGAFTVGSVLYYGFALTVAVQSRERITTTQRGLVGLVGETRGELTPEGPVYVKGTLWRGRSNDGPIAAGTRIRVRGVDGLTLRVEPEGPEGSEPPAG